MSGKGERFRAADDKRLHQYLVTIIGEGGGGGVTDGSRNMRCNQELWERG